MRNWIDAGALPAFRVGRRVRVRRSDFDSFVDAGYIGGRPSQAGDGICDGDVPLPGGTAD